MMLVIITIMTVSDIVRRDTPPKNEAAPIRAKAPGSTQAQYESGSVWSPHIDTMSIPTRRPYKPPIKLNNKTEV